MSRARHQSSYRLLVRLLSLERSSLRGHGKVILLLLRFCFSRRRGGFWHSYQLYRYSTWDLQQGHLILSQEYLLNPREDKCMDPKGWHRLLNRQVPSWGVFMLDSQDGKQHRCSFPKGWEQGEKQHHLQLHRGFQAAILTAW